MAKLSFTFKSKDRKNALEGFMQTHDITFEKHTNIYTYYYNTKVEPNTVLLLGLNKNVRGNMQYILDELNHNPFFKNYKVYVRVDENTLPIVLGYIEKNGWSRTKTVLGNNDYAKKMESCKYLITETFFSESWIKKPEQIYINIWHGTPLKKLGLAKNTRNIPLNGNTQKNFINADVLLYPNEYTYEKMIESYKVRELLTGKALMLGYPRCGGLLQTAAKDNSAIRKELAPNGERVFVYMPTFKDYISNEEVVMESKELLDYLDENLHDDWILYVNLHHKLSDVIDYSKFRHIKKFPPLVDSYTLMAVSDALITDYSSVFFDYLTLGKQIILYVEDIERYVRARGTYMDMLTLPFDMAHSKKEIIECLAKGEKTYDDSKAIAHFCSYDSGDNARKLCKLICIKKNSIADVAVKVTYMLDRIKLLKDGKLNRMFKRYYGRVSRERLKNSLPLREIPKKGKRTVLAVTECCADTAEFGRLRVVVNSCDQERVDIFVATNNLRTGTGKNAYPFLFNTPAFGYKDTVKLSNEGGQLLERYKNGEFEYSEIFEVLKYDYCLNVRSNFGESRFDILFVYDVSDIEQLLSMTMQRADKKYLYLNNELIKKLLENDRYTLDAMSALSQFYDKIFAFKTTVSDRLAQCVDLEAENTAWLKNVYELNSADGIRELLLGNEEM